MHCIVANVVGTYIIHTLYVIFHLNFQDNNDGV